MNRLLSIVVGSSVPLIISFTVMKLTHNISWSWFWIFSPIWFWILMFIGLIVMLNLTSGYR